MILSLNSSALSSYSFNTSNNTKTQKTSSDSKQASSNEVLGYKVDKNGYFTEEFNEAAGIPEDIKIHSSSLESLVKVTTNPDKFFKEFKGVDIAKTIGNAYKILTQVVGEDVLNSQDSFTLNEIANFPQGYEYNSQSMQVSKIYQNSFDYNNASLGFNYQNDTNTKINTLFFNSSENIAKGYPATDIFNNNNGGKESKDFGVWFNPNGDKYTNPDGSITKGGLLVAIVNANSHTKEGETTIWGKMQGFDKNISSKEANNFKILLGFNGTNTLGLVVDTQAYFSLMAETDTETFKKKYAEFVKSNNEALERLKKENEEWEEQFKNYKDPIAQMFEDIQKFQKEQLKHLEKQRQEQRLAQQRKRLDMKA